MHVYSIKPLIFILIFVLNIINLDLVYALNYVEGELIIKMKSSEGSTTNNKLFFGKLNQKGFSLKSSFGNGKMHLLKFTNQKTVKSAIEDLSTDSDIEYVEPNFILKKVEEATSRVNAQSYEQILSTVNDYSAGSYSQSRLNVGVDEVWAEMTMSSNQGPPVVAVIDTGVDYNHTVLRQAEALWTNPLEIPNNGIDDDGNGYIDDYYGWNFNFNQNLPWDDEGHGTHVSGIVAGLSFDIYENPTPKAKIKVMALKFLGSDGSGDTADAIKAIDYAIHNGAQIINASWGGESYSRALHDALTRAYNSGLFVVTAAGNAGSNNDVKPIYPSSLSIPGLISVAACNGFDRLASFSNYGVQSVHIAAPGVSIASFYPNNLYGYSSGTSMAAPFIAGLGALLLREAPHLSGFQLKEIILNSVQASELYSQKLYTSGRVDAIAALRSAKSLASSQSVIPNYTATTPDRAIASEDTGNSGGDSGGKSAGGCGTIQAVQSFIKGNHSGSGPGGPDPLPVMILLFIPLVLWAIIRSFSKHTSEAKINEFDMRFSARISVTDSVIVKTKQGQFEAQLKNISKGGLAFTFNGKRVDKNEQVSFLFTSKDGKEQIEVSARIVWTDDKSIAGVQFNQLSHYIQGFFLRSYAEL